MFYDLHIHSCLSPCAEDEMTPNNICNMAVLKGLNLIAVCDHNSTRQLDAVSAAAELAGIRFLFGCELQSIEEVHVLGLFNSSAKAHQIQQWIDSRMPDIPNREDFFGKEQLLNSQDEVIGSESRLLLVSLNASLSECVDEIHACGGRAVLAHVLDRKNSVTTQLGFIPMDLAYDGLEVKSDLQKQEVLMTHPWIHAEDTVWFNDSDAHRLVDIAEAEHDMSEETYQRLWGDTT